MSKDGGGAAFPNITTKLNIASLGQCLDECNCDAGHCIMQNDPQQRISSMLISNGMSLRDYFAAAALQNPILCDGKAEDWQISAWFGKNSGGITKQQIVAKQASIYADAMLAERAKK